MGIGDAEGSKYGPVLMIWLKVNYDGAFSHSSQTSGIGIVVRNGLGELVNGKEKQIKEESALLVEALASK